MNRYLKMCLNWKVAAALAAAVAAVWVFAPKVAVGVAPLLLIAVCPLSMLLMMATMRGGHQDTSPDHPGGLDTAPSERRLAELKSQMSEVQARQDSLANEIRRLEDRRQEVEGGSEQSRLNR